MSEATAGKSPDGVRGEERDPAAFDVIVAGGGMVGALLAAALAFGNHGRTPPPRVCVLDGDLPEPFEPGTDPAYDIRVSALSVASRRMFDAVGAWRGVVARRACPYREMAGPTTIRTSDPSAVTASGARRR